MALASNALPFGLRDVKLFPLDAATGVRTGPGVDLPASRERRDQRGHGIGWRQHRHRVGAP